MRAYTGQVPDTEPGRTWLLQAACRQPGVHPDEMFPDNNEARIEHARRICAPCPVRLDCLRDAIRVGDDQHGIRGGLKASERRAVARELRRRQQEAAV